MPKHALGPGGVVQSAAVQQLALGTHAPLAQTFLPVALRSVSQPFVSGAVLSQSAKPLAQPVYVHAPAVQAAPMLCVASQATPHAPQLWTVSVGVHMPLQHACPAAQPCVASQPAAHVPFAQSCPAGQSEVDAQPTHCPLLQTCPLLAAQSAFVLQPPLAASPGGGTAASVSSPEVTPVSSPPVAHPSGDAAAITRSASKEPRTRGRMPRSLHAIARAAGASRVSLSSRAPPPRDALVTRGRDARYRPARR